MEKKYKDELLQFLLYPYGYSIWKYAQGFLVVFLMMWVQLYAFYIMNDKIFRKIHLPNILTSQVVILCNVLNIFLQNWKKLSGILDRIEEYRLPWNTAGKETYETIFHEIQILKRKMILLMMGNTIACLIIFPFPDICQPFHRMSQKHFPKWINIIDILVFIMLLLIGYGTTHFCYKFIYVFTHIKIQCYLLNGLMKKISSTAMEGINEREYQSITYEKLVQLVKIHRNIRRLFDMSIKSLRWIFHPIYLSTSLSIVSTLYFFMIEKGSLLNPRILICYATHIYCVSILLNTGQQLSNEYEKIFTNIYECPWYTWNKTNKQMIIQLMINSMKPMEISAFGLMSLDYSLSIKIGKICWSMIAVLKTFNEKNR